MDGDPQKYSMNRITYPDFDRKIINDNSTHKMFVDILTKDVAIIFEQLQKQIGQNTELLTWKCHILDDEFNYVQSIIRHNRKMFN